MQLEMLEAPQDNEGGFQPEPGDIPKAPFQIRWLALLAPYSASYRKKLFAGLWCEDVEMQIAACLAVGNLGEKAKEAIPRLGEIYHATTDTISDPFVSPNQRRRRVPEDYIRNAALTALGKIAGCSAESSLAVVAVLNGSASKYLVPPAKPAPLGVPSEGVREVYRSPKAWWWSRRRGFVMSGCWIAGWLLYMLPAAVCKTRAAKLLQNLLLAGIGYGDPIIRIMSCRFAGWGKSKNRFAVPALLASLNDAEQMVRIEAIRSLGRIGDGKGELAFAISEELRPFIHGRIEDLDLILGQYLMDTAAGIIEHASMLVPCLLELLERSILAERSYEILECLAKKNSEAAEAVCKRSVAVLQVPAGKSHGRTKTAELLRAAYAKLRTDPQKSEVCAEMRKELELLIFIERDNNILRMLNDMLK